MDYGYEACTGLLDAWHRELLARQPVEFPRSVRTQGTYSGGSRMDFAKVWIEFGPSETFVVLLSSEIVGAEARRYAKYAVYGVLDVLVAGHGSPLIGVALTVWSIDVDPVSSNEMAFRRAGRMAAQEALRCRDPATSQR